MSMGARLRKLLEQNGISQTELAQRLDISLSTLNGYITDYREPDISMLSRLAKALNTTTDYLVIGEASHSPQGDPYHEKVRLIAHHEGITLTEEQETAVTRYMKFLVAEDENQ